ncbi:MAG: hypothetical protein ACXWCR_15540, partial [Flavitalea sp.]
NIFLADNYNKSEFRQITQLTNMKYGTARYPAQYNTTHFTFISDENGISNRYAGFFSTERAGVDTVYVIGESFLRNPDRKEMDSTLRNAGKQEPDSMFVFSVTNDSAYVFPITNYQSGLIETKVAGDQGMNSEVRQEGNLKFLYKLKVDETALRRRNVNPRPTDFRKKTISDQETANGRALQFNNQPGAVNDTSKNKDVFETEFEQDTAANRPLITIDEGPTETVLSKAKLFDYKLKFSVDNFSGAFSNDILVNRYEPFTGSLPITLQSGGAFNGMLKASVFDLFEDIRFTGAIRLPLIGGQGTGVSIGGGGVGVFVPTNQSLFDGGGEWYARGDYLKKKFDYSLIYYRKTDIGFVNGINNTNEFYEGKLYTNLFQGVVKFPFDKVRSVRMSVGVRRDKVVVRGDLFNDSASLKAEDRNKQDFIVSRIEYVHDNTIQKTMNIMNGLRYKVYIDINSQFNKADPLNSTEKPGKLMFNAGVDARYYYPIYRNFIWAGRAAADFSWGSQKIIYYLGGVDGWMFPKYNSEPQPQDQSYAFQ